MHLVLFLFEPLGTLPRQKTDLEKHIKKLKCICRNPQLGDTIAAAQRCAPCGNDGRMSQ